MQEPLEAEVPPGLLTIPQVAEYLGVCRAHVYRLINNDLPLIRLGRLRTHSHDVITALAARPGGDHSSLIVHFCLSIRLFASRPWGSFGKPFSKHPPINISWPCVLPEPGQFGHIHDPLVPSLDKKAHSCTIRNV